MIDLSDIPTSALVRMRDMLEERVRLARNRADIAAYAEDELGVTLWPKQAAIARALLDPPHRVLVKSANGIGKTLLAGVVATWFYRNFDPGICIITGPRFDQVRDTTFKEVRRFLGDAPGMFPRLPRVESSPNHYINATTAGSDTAFQGIHEPNLLLLFEEALGVDKVFWEAGRGILSGGENTFWLAIFNPTDTATHAYNEELSGRWRVFSVSAFEHPNIHEELCGRPAPIPAAVRLELLLDNMNEWGDWPAAGLEDPTDIDLECPAVYELPELSPAMLGGIRERFPGRYWRPGPIGEARILGRYPSQSAYSIFSEAAFDAAGRSSLTFERTDLPCIGCDVARFGDDLTAIHVRRGGVSLRHESYGKQDTVFTANRIRGIAEGLAESDGLFKPEDVRILVDDTGVGGGVADILRRHGLNVVPVNAGQSPIHDGKYPNARSEILFALAERMRLGKVSLAKLPESARAALRQQAIGITYKLDAAERRVAEPKDKTKERLGRSPDDLDAFGLAYYPVGSGWAVDAANVERPGLFERREPTNGHVEPPDSPAGWAAVPARSGGAGLFRRR